MVALTKKGIEPHDILIDTNILHHNDKSHIVNPEFNEFWEKHSNEFRLSLKIPDVVRGELLFQQTTSALKTLKRANESMERLSNFTSGNYSQKIPEKRIKKDINDRMNKWIKQAKGEVLKTPITAINWDDIIQNSVWRLPPFSYDEKKEDLEKGFRDNLILETVYHHVTNTEHSSIFICNDNLLNEALLKRVGKNSNLKIYNSLNETDAYLKLRRENFTEKFVDSIINKASLKFLNNKDPNCIIRKENLRSKLFDLIKDITSSPYSIDSDNNDFEPEDEWKATTKGVFSRFGKSQFDSIENGHTFNWIEDVKFRQSFDVINWIDEKTSAELFINLKVYWKSNVSTNGRFTKITYCDSKIINSAIRHENA